MYEMCNQNVGYEFYKGNIHTVQGNSRNADLFGTNPNNYTAEAVTCLNLECERSMAASRYAPHLEKCLHLKTRGTGTRSRYINYDEDKLDDLK